MFYTESSGRIFTDYSPSADIDNGIKKKYNLKTNSEYRHFLQTHAVQLMQDNLKTAETSQADAMCSCTDCNPPNSETGVVATVSKMCSIL